ncbi:MAG: DUF3575 domain-containing protein [Myxococcaceae bacterium]|nr:DUF3575 domain-containing protein [Myxococcaceae bacterium]
MRMHWGILVAGGVLMVAPGTGRADEPKEERRTLVLAQPVYGSTGSVAASVEHAVGTHLALQGTVQASVYLDDSQYAEFETEFSTNRWSVGVDPGVHFYVAGRAPEGFWVGPHVELSVLHHTTVTDVSAPEGGFVPLESGWRTLQYGGSVRAGYTAILAPGLSVQVGLGLAVLGGRNTHFRARTLSGGLQSGALPDQRTLSLSPRMTLGVGWAF